MKIWTLWSLGWKGWLMLLISPEDFHCRLFLYIFKPAFCCPVTSASFSLSSNHWQQTCFPYGQSLITGAPSVTSPRKSRVWWDVAHSMFLRMSDAFNTCFLFLKPRKENTMLLPSPGEQNYVWSKPSGRRSKPRLWPRTTSLPVSC